ncbi:MAG: sugar phosphate isomerase/epimerase [Armatimonadetes bacterium]|nr:sugar phosphate isomerase/epimerase [Armatimonadota bacterium]
MQIGIFTRTFIRPSLEETLSAVRRSGIRHVQFGLSCAGLPELPEEINEATARALRQEFAAHDIEMAAVSGTFNMIHPDIEVRQKGLRGLRELAAACQEMGTSVITLCTGTRNPDSMWRPHPDNDTPEAWRDLLHSMDTAAKIAEEQEVTLAFEPEVSNTVDSARKARRLMDEIGSDRLRVCMDGANLYHAGELPRMREILDEAFDLLGSDIALAHAKDVDRDGEAGHLAAGTGLLDYDAYVAGLQRVGYAGPVILHSLTEKQVPSCVAFLSEKLSHMIVRDSEGG